MNRCKKSYPRSTGRVVFITGSAIGQESERFFQGTGRPVLQKPFTTNELKERIRQGLKVIEAGLEKTRKELK